MYCSYCGASLDEDSIFCRYCGKKLAGTIEQFRSNATTKEKGDFIILRCPKCAGSLKITPGMDSLKCEFCGTECIVRRESNSVALEAFACCPTCHRNDKSVKASMKFGKPIQPKKELLPHSGLGCLGTLLLIASIFFLIGGIANVNSGNENAGIIMIIACSSIILTIIFVSANNNQEINEKNSLITQRSEKIEQQYKQNLTLWEQMYYCERDDTFFDLKDGDVVEKQSITEELFPGWRMPY